MTMTAKPGVCDAECRCGRVGCKGGTRTPDIVVEKGHVRRAIVAANAVDRVATANEGPEPGVVLMTALLLVERLASSFDCEPHALLAKMANCFELKRSYTASARPRN